LQVNKHTTAISFEILIWSSNYIGTYCVISYINHSFSTIELCKQRMEDEWKIFGDTISFVFTPIYFVKRFVKMVIKIYFKFSEVSNKLQYTPIKWDARYVVHFFSVPWIFYPFQAKKLRISGTLDK